MALSQTLLGYSLVYVFFLNTGNGYYHFITVYTFSDYNLLPRGTFSFIFYYLLSSYKHYQGTQPASRLQHQI